MTNVFFPFLGRKIKDTNLTANPVTSEDSSSELGPVILNVNEEVKCNNFSCVSVWCFLNKAT